jgi:hypothetical protein
MVEGLAEGVMERRPGADSGTASEGRYDRGSERATRDQDVVGALSSALVSGGGATHWAIRSRVHW